MKRILEKVIPTGTGLAIEVNQGHHLRVIDLEGKQVVDMAVFNLENLREKLSTSNSRNRYLPEVGRPYAPRDHLEQGDWLMSTLCRPMMTIVEETPQPKGVHDACNRMCDRFLYEIFFGLEQDGCHEIISKAVEPYGLMPEDIPDTFDIFMKYPHNCSVGHFEILDPVSQPGDYIEFRAEMNCLVGLSCCPFEPCCGGRSTPVKVELFEHEDYVPRPILTPEAWRKELLRRRRAKDS
jgi:uncharacterized protein YcgI (DUF1989 family)